MVAWGADASSKSCSDSSSKFRRKDSMRGVGSSFFALKNATQTGASFDASTQRLKTAKPLSPVACIDVGATPTTAHELFRQVSPTDITDAHLGSSYQDVPQAAPAAGSDQAHLAANDKFTEAWEAQQRVEHANRLLQAANKASDRAARKMLMTARTELVGGATAGDTCSQQAVGFADAYLADTPASLLDCIVMTLFGVHKLLGCDGSLKPI